MSKSKSTSDSLDFDRDLVTTDEDARALRENRPLLKPGTTIDFDRLNVPAWLVTKEMLRKVDIVGQPVFEL